MRKRVISTIAVLSVFSLAMLPVVFAADDFMDAADHTALVAVYEKHAAEQGSLISQHERMKVDSGWLKRVNYSASAMNGMNAHCDAIIAKAKELQAELLKAAEWHKSQG